MLIRTVHNGHMPINIDINTQDGCQPKFKQLAEAVKDGIANGRLKHGEALPSVSVLCSEYGLARDTVFKAYSNLKEQGIISSHPGKGYFVSDRTKRIFVFLDTFKAYKEVLYDGLFRHLPHNVIVDVNFHHYNPNLFKKLIDESVGKYGKYIVMPFLGEQVRSAMQKLPQDKLLVIDWNLYTNESSNAVYQDFDRALSDGLEQILDKIEQYDEFRMLYPSFTYHPHQSVDCFVRFCRRHGIRHEVETDPDALNVKSGTAYFSVSDRMLAKLLHQARAMHLTVGKDVGIVSYNETPMKEFIANGITVFSTDFEQMGRMAAQFVVRDEPLRLCVPSRMIIRNSI